LGKEDSLVYQLSDLPYLHTPGIAERDREDVQRSETCKAGQRKDGEMIPNELFVFRFSHSNHKLSSRARRGAALGQKYEEGRLTSDHPFEQGDERRKRNKGTKRWGTVGSG